MTMTTLIPTTFPLLLLKDTRQAKLTVTVRFFFLVGTGESVLNSDLFRNSEIISLTSFLEGLNTSTFITRD